MSGQKQQIQLKQSQALNLTPQLEKSLQILQYNHQELQMAVTDMLANNVMLTASDNEEMLDDLLDIEHHVDEIDDSLTTLEEIPKQLDADMEWEQVYDIEPSTASTAGHSDFDDNRYAGQLSLDEQIENAIYMAFNHSEDFALAQLVLTNLDEHYFLSHSPEQLAKQHHVDLQRLTAVIETIKHLEPAGVASQTIQECLLAQLHRLPDYHDSIADAHEILSDYFAYIGKKPELIMKRLDLSPAEYEAAQAVIQQLSPYPNEDYQKATAQLIKPDVYVHQRMGIFYASLNEDARFDIHINQDYAALAKQCKGDEKYFITSQLQEAKSFIRALEQRNQTILRVANAIVLHQQNYFVSGDFAMQPLLMQDVAQLLQLHESTVSRTVNGKYLSFNRELIELRHFFSKAVPLRQTDEQDKTGVSMHAIKTKISELIQQEDSQKPLSDTKIEKILSDEGIDISRRTISKYREQLGFLKSSKRKQKK